MLSPPALLRFLAICSLSSRLVASEVAVYFPDYRFREGETYRFYGTTNLVLFSATPTGDGSVDFSRIGPGIIAMASRARDQQPEMKISLSIGGWGKGNIFGEAVSTAESRKRFAEDLVEFCEAHSLDGIDVDWEFPKTEQDHGDFVLFVRELSGLLRPSGRILTVATGYTRPLLPEAYQHVDRVHLMAYQPWDPPEAGYEAWLEAAVTRTLEAGVPPEKLMLGIPFFIKEMGGERRAISWKKLVGADAEAIPKSEFGYSPAGHEICELRLKLVKQHGLAGVMVWDHGHDSPDPEHSLLRRLSEAIAD